jgi:predicted RNase H-like nuclease
MALRINPNPVMGNGINGSPAGLMRPMRRRVRGWYTMEPMKFVGVDLGWQGRPSGLALIEDEAGHSQLTALCRQEQDIPGWVARMTNGADAMIAVDAPLVIRNATGARDVDREISSCFGKYHAGCHSANLSRPFAASTTGFGRALAELGFAHAATIEAQKPGRYQIEVYPHPASVQLFDLPRIIKYKKGHVSDRRKGLARLREMILDRLPRLAPAVHIASLPPVPTRGGDEMKSVEDQLDAIIAAYVGLHWWYWGTERNRCHGTLAGGYIIVPHRVSE